jgi:branched-chain amino acid transport system ATP-binding protein
MGGLSPDETHAISLRVQDVTVDFGGIRALDDVSLDLIRGELTAIIGPNGAGKTTLFNCITGVYRPTSGSIMFGDADVTKLAQHQIARLGIARTFQNLALFPGLSVLDNLMVGRYRFGRTGVLRGALFLPGVVAEEIEQRQRVEEIIDMLQITSYRDVLARDLPYGLQKRVELGRALAQDAEILLLDEPMAGMTLEEKESMARFILDVQAELGTTIVLVEHDMGVVMDIANRVAVLDFGILLAFDVPEEIQNNEEVIRAYLGTEADAGSTRHHETRIDEER